MAVTSCTLIREGDLSTEFRSDRSRSYDLTYQIKTNSVMGPISTQIGALFSSPNALPDLWATYACLGDSDSAAYCDSCKLKRKPADPKIWTASLHFATLGRGQDPSDAIVSPYSRGVRYRGEKMVATKPIFRDRTGAPIVNSAKEEFDDPLEGEVVYPLLVATRAIPSLDVWISDMGNFLHSVNTTTYRGRGARQWWCADIECSDIIYENGSAYYQETWRLGLNIDSWDEYLLDRGWKVLTNDVPPKKINATDDNGKAISEPVLLDGTGKKLPASGNPVAIAYRCKREVAWSTIPV